jgi:hypothetical protein
VQVDDSTVDEAAIVLSLHYVLEKKQQERRRGWEKVEISRGGGYSDARSRRCWSVAWYGGQASINNSGKVQQAAAKSSSLRCVVLMEKNRRKKKKSKGRERLAGPPGWAVNWAELR